MMRSDNTFIGAIGIILTAIIIFALYILGIAIVVFVVGYIILWLLRDFGILQHFGITLLSMIMG